MLHLYTYRTRHGAYSDVWAPDVTTARANIMTRGDAPTTFFTLYRVTNVPPRNLTEES